jgi:hypothetical protein
MNKTESDNAGWLQRLVRPRPAWYILPKIPKGWHRMKTGALVRPTDLYFNFSDRRWMQWPYKTTIVRHTGSDLTSTFYIRRNRKRPNDRTEARGTERAK